MKKTIKKNSKKKSALNQILGIANNFSGMMKFVPTAEEAYHIGKDFVNSSHNTYDIACKKDKIRKLILEIGNRAYLKELGKKDKNIKAEIECIKELGNELVKLK